MGDLGRRVIGLREKLGMSQKGLAEATGLPQATISRIERNVIEQPRVEVLKKLAEALHVTVDYLIERTPHMSFSETISADNRAAAIFRDYEGMSEEEKGELMDFVQWLRSKRRNSGRGSRS